MAASPAVDTHEFDHLLSAFEDNFTFFFLNYGVAGGLEIMPHVALSNPRAPFFLFNIVTKFDGESLGDKVDDVIAATLAKMRTAPGGFWWCVLPGSRPLDLGDRLQKHGLHASGPGMPAMAYDLNTLPATAPALPPGYSVMEVTTPVQLDAWVKSLITGYGMPDILLTPISELEKRTYGLRFPNNRRFAVLYDGEVVGTSSLFLFAGVAGVQCVSTLPAHRRRGLATALTWQCMAEGRKAGFSTATLQSTEAGFPVYKKMGWLTVAHFKGYHPAPASAPPAGGGLPVVTVLPRDATPLATH